MADADKDAGLVASIIRFPVRGDSSGFLKASAKIVSEYYPLKGFNGGLAGADFEFEEGGGEADRAPIHWILNWNSYEDALAFTDQPNFPTFASKILHTSRLPSLYHVHLSTAPPERLYTSPALESVRITLNQGIDKSAWRGNFAKFEEALVASAPGYIAHITGWVRGVENEFYVLIGWESVAHHRDWIATGGGQEFVDRFILEGIAGFDMVHWVAGEVIPVKNGN